MTAIIIALFIVGGVNTWCRWHYGRIDEAQAAERAEIATERQQLTLWAQRLVVAEITVRRQRPITPAPAEPGDHPGIARYTIGTPTLPPEGRNDVVLPTISEVAEIARTQGKKAAHAALTEGITYRFHGPWKIGATEDASNEFLAANGVIPAPVPWDVT